MKDSTSHRTDRTFCDEIPAPPGLDGTWRAVVGSGPIRTFDTGATRDADKTFDPEGFLSPLVIQRFCEYMTRHRIQADGSIRDSDNWQKGIPREVYMKSLWRHFRDAWAAHRGWPSSEGLENALCGILFNTMGYLHEILKRQIKTTPHAGTMISQDDADWILADGPWPGYTGG